MGKCRHCVTTNTDKHSSQTLEDVEQTQGNCRISTVYCTVLKETPEWQQKLDELSVEFQQLTALLWNKLRNDSKRERN